MAAPKATGVAGSATHVVSPVAAKVQPNGSPISHPLSIVKITPYH